MVRSLTWSLPLLPVPVDQELSANQTSRETIHGVRSFMGWSQVPEFHNNPFAGARTQQTGKLSVKVPVDKWLCRKFQKLNLTVQEGSHSQHVQ